MTRKQVVIEALKFRRPPYVPWSWGPTIDCAARLRERLGRNDLGAFLDNHFYGVLRPLDKLGTGRLRAP